MDDELEPEILSYREFRNRETLRAWQQRRRALESPPGRSRNSLRRDGDPPTRPGESRGGAFWQRQGDARR
jgi:hypothetical protein